MLPDGNGLKLLEHIKSLDKGDGSNNSFSIEVLSGPEALLPPSLVYSDSLVYIPEKRETEPARVLTARFAGNGGTAYRLVVTMPTFEREDLISSIFWHIVVLYFVVVLTVFLATILVLNRSMRPLYNLLAWLDRYLPSIECDIDLPRQLMVRMNEELATVFITNLLKNAFLHSPDGGRISVRFAGDCLVFANDGTEPLNADRLFDRFYKQGKTGSTGLGLALVGSIARYYKLNVEYSFEGGKHRFEVAL